MLTEQEPPETLIKRNSKENLNIEYYASKGNKKGKGNMKWILIASSELRLAGNYVFWYMLEHEYV